MQESATAAPKADQSVPLSRILPKQPQQRQQLRGTIQNVLARLQKAHQDDPNAASEQKIKLLQLRLLLIDSCTQMSLTRLDHLESIFRHYCTHIFKTGKHMTFERLEYEKVHLTMERFFLFLKDFELTLMKGTERKEEVVDKNSVIIIFKRVSSNCRDLSFEEFVRCLEKLAVLYYDEKQVFYEKRDKARADREKKKQEYERKKLIRMKKSQPSKQSELQIASKQNTQNNEEAQQQNREGEAEPEGEENDELIKDLMKNKDIENPTEQIKQITSRYVVEQEQQDQQNDFNDVETPALKNKYEELSEEQLGLLTTEEKIEYFYKFMIRIDSLKEYKDKLTELNLPIFQKGKSHSKQSTNSSAKMDKQSEDEQLRIEELKRKMEEKKLKRKASPIPKPKEDDKIWQKAEEEKRKKREIKKEREQKAKQKSKVETDALIQKKIESQKSVKQKRPEYNQKQVDWNSLGKMSIDQLKLNKFNPNKYFTKDEEDDRVFLDQYDSAPRGHASNAMENRERSSSSIVQDLKKRVGEVQRKEMRQQKQLEMLSKKMGQNMVVKNRF